MSQMTPGSANITPEFMRRKAPELARDIVMQLDSASNLAKNYGLDDFQWNVLRHWPAFIQTVRQANEELGGDAGTLERARRKAALAVAEVGVTDMAVIMGDAKVSARDRIAAFSELREVAGISGKAIAAAGSGGAIGFGGALVQIIMSSGTIMVGEAEPEEPLPLIEGECVEVGDDA